MLQKNNQKYYLLLILTGYLIFDCFLLIFRQFHWKPFIYKISFVAIFVLLHIIFFKPLMKGYRIILMSINQFICYCGIKKLILFLNKGNRWLFLLFIIHFLLVNHFFPFIEVFNNSPIVRDDYPYFYYETNAFKQVFLQGKISGFNFHFTVGFIVFHMWDKLGGILETIFFLIPSVIVFKIYIYFQFLFFPYFMYVITKNFNFQKPIRIISFFFGIITFSFYNTLKLLLFGGQYAFLFSCVLAILSISYIYNYILFKNIKSIFMGLFLFIISFLVHPYMLLIYVIPGVYLLYILLKENKMYWILVLILIFSFIFVPEVTKYFTLYVSYTFDPTHHYAGILGIIYDFLTSPFQSIILVSGLLSLKLILKQKKDYHYLFMLILLTSIFYFVIGTFGSYIPILINLKTVRLIIALTILLVPFSSYYWYHFYFKIRKKILLKFFIILLLIIYIYLNVNSYTRLTLGIPFVPIDVAIREKLNLPTDIKTNLIFPTDLKELYLQRLSTKIPEDVQSLIHWIKFNTNNSARILIEDSGYETERQYGGQLISLFPQWTNRLFFNLPLTYIIAKENIKVASFWNKRILDKTIDKYSENDFNEIFDLYNIKWIIVFSNESKQKFDNYTSLLKKINKIGNFSIYETAINQSFFIIGNGSIYVDFNMLKILNASKGDLILKFPYTFKCKSYPSLDIERVDYKYTPTFNGFIWVKDNIYDMINITC